MAHHHYPLIRLAALTGLRRGEPAALRWSDVDLSEATVSVRQSTTVVDGKPITGDVKTKRSRRVLDIDAGTVATLKAWARTQKEYACCTVPAGVEPGACSRCPLAGTGIRTRSRKHSSDSGTHRWRSRWTRTRM